MIWQQGVEFMISYEVTVISPSGLHLRPAAELLKTVSAHQSEVKIRFGGREIMVDSILHLIKLEIRQGSTITLLVDGPDEEQAMKAILQKLAENQIFAATSR